MFEVSNWYWLASDGRIYSSAAGAVITAEDENYTAWTEAGHGPTPWPRDDAGEQTDEALQAVLSPYGLYMPTAAGLTAYAAARRYSVETGGITVNGASIDTTRESQSLITGAYAYSQANPEAAITFKAKSGWVTLSAEQVAGIATAVAAHVQAAFATEQAVDAAIDAGTITTTAEVDGADWPA